MNLPLIYKHGVGKHFDIIKYPDGQQSVQLDMEYFNDPKQLIDIKCSVRNFTELEVLLALAAALRKQYFSISSITFNYLFGMRSDRSFNPGQPNYFRDVLAPIINSLKIDDVYLLHPHSRLSWDYVDKAHFNIPPIFYHSYYKSMIRIAADESAQYWYDDCIGSFIKRRKNDVTLCLLPREVYGKIDQCADIQAILVLDDLCDGGATFREISMQLKEMWPHKPLYLYVTHGLFTKGIDSVTSYFDKVITTNSYQEIKSSEKIEVIDVWN